MRPNKNSTIKRLALALLASLSFSCIIDQALDCSDICNRFQDCFDSNFDAESCTNECRDNAKGDKDFADKADACESCIDDRSCTEDFACVDECFGIAP